MTLMCYRAHQNLIIPARTLIASTRSRPACVLVAFDRCMEPKQASVYAPDDPARLSPPGHICRIAVSTFDGQICLRRSGPLPVMQLTDACAPPVWTLTKSWHDHRHAPRPRPGVTCSAS
jgi:hypothetical protein